MRPDQIVSRVVFPGIILLLSACGGEDAPAAPPPVATPPPPPPPVATNTAPVASITTDNATPDEGQPFMVDASASSDPDGDALTYMWTQTAGPTLDIDDPTSPMLSFTAPELTETVTATFEVEVSDGELFTTASVDVQLTNIDLSPDFSPGFIQSDLLTFGDFSPRFSIPTALGITLVELIGSDDALSGRQLSVDPLGFLTADGGISFEGDFLSASSVQLLSLAETNNFGGLLLIDFLVSISEEQGLLSFLFDNDDGPVNGGDYIVVDTIDFASPCALVDAGGIVLVAGRRSGISAGVLSTNLNSVADSSPPFVVTEVEFSETQKFGDDRSLCTLSPVFANIDNSLRSPDVSSFPADPFLLALDDESGRVFSIGQVRDENGTVLLELVSSVAVELQSTNALELVASTTLSGQGLALVYTDGEHRGEHRLVVLGFDDDGEIRQATYSWPIGIPTGVVSRSRIGIGSDEVIVVTSSSPEAVVFQPIAGGSRNLLEMEGPSYFQIGLGAGSVSTGPNSVNLLVAYPDQGEVQAFQIENG